MVEEAARALIPGPVATTALATLVIDDPGAARGAGFGPADRRRCAATPTCVTRTAGVSGTVDHVLGADTAAACCCCRSAITSCWSMPLRDGVAVESLEATDFSRPLAKVTLTSVPAIGPSRLAAAVRGPGRHGAGRRGRRCGAVDVGDRNRVRQGARAVRQADRQLPGHQAHVRRDAAARRKQVSAAAADAAVRRSGCCDDDDQLAIAAAIAAAIGIGAAKANAKDCIQVLGGIGITWEHDAHLYLRRAYGIGQFLGGRPRPGCAGSRH